MMGALFCAIATLPLLNISTEKIQQNIPHQDRIKFFDLDKIAMLGIIIASVGGVIDGAFTSLFPIFGLGRGFSDTQIGSLLAIIGFGGLIFQYPVGWFADQLGFMKTSFLVAISTASVTFLMAFLAMSFKQISIVAFIFGGVVASFLTLAIIAAASTKVQAQMARNMSKIAIAFTVCSIAGSLSAGFSAASLGSDAFLWIVLLASSIIAIVFANQHLV
jgi:predicted MFS family arabinose efflux permease